LITSGDIALKIESSEKEAVGVLRLSLKSLKEIG
jgi:hypothetical protein